MDLITSGLELLPEKLTPKAIFTLSFHELDKIEDELFTVQVVSVKHVGEEDDEQEEISGAQSITQIQRKIQF